MRIDNSFLAGVNAGRFGPVQRVEKKGSARDKESASSTHSSSGELANLLSVLGQEPAVREDVLQRAEERLANGFYEDVERAEETARAILESGDG